MFTFFSRAAFTLAATIYWASPSYSQQIVARFSPHGGIASAIRVELDSATTSIQCQAYQFSSTQIFASFIDARKRGIPCTVILDASQSQQNWSLAQQLRYAGCVVLTDGKHKINHNKVLIIDNKTLITGSYNFSASAENTNAESILFIRDPATVAAFQANFQLHLSHSLPLPASLPTGKLPKRPIPNHKK